MNIINSVNNEKIKAIVKLKKAAERKVKQVVLVDGAREIELAKKSGNEILELFYCPELIKKEVKDFFGLNPEKITATSKSVFEKICYKESPDGYFALVKIKPLELEQITLSKNPLVIVLEAVEKPGNLGAILRSSYAAGIEAIIINDNQTDIFNPNVIRASEGFVFVLPIAISSVEETAKWLKEKKIISLAAATNGKNIYTKEKMNGSLAIVLGSEANGLSDKWLKRADKLIKIPMTKGIDSLNVSVSAAILMYEALRQREIKQKISK